MPTLAEPAPLNDGQNRRDLTNHSGALAQGVAPTHSATTSGSALFGGQHFKL